MLLIPGLWSCNHAPSVRHPPYLLTSLPVRLGQEQLAAVAAQIEAMRAEAAAFRAAAEGSARAAADASAATVDRLNERIELLEVRL